MSKVTKQKVQWSTKAQIILNKGKLSPILQNIEPMLATLVTTPTNGKGWVYEMKWDGFRAVSYLNNGVVQLSSNREGKMYIDFLMNRPQASVAAPYSLRPKKGATVSMPLRWEEVKKGLQPKDFTILNAIARLKEVGDIFKGVLGKGIDIAKAEKKIASIFGEEVMNKKY